MRVEKPCALEQYLEVFKALSSLRAVLHDEYDAMPLSVESLKLCGLLTLSLSPLRMLIVGFVEFVPCSENLDIVAGIHDSFVLQHVCKLPGASTRLKIIPRRSYIH
jgi:hypothetical protein